ncbi:hypothetical protein [Anabaena sp. UHCC 0451]|nr:hypothetical protein [Anabaena sp. UHCC 0451]MEA5578109.1 hypothetical protein [Anabaena sp. UHCC 0451]
MQVLLDTHTLLWFFSGNENISITARNLVEDTNNLKYISDDIPLSFPAR